MDLQCLYVFWTAGLTTDLERSWISTDKRSVCAKVPHHNQHLSWDSCPRPSLSQNFRACLSDRWKTWDGDPARTPGNPHEIHFANPPCQLHIGSGNSTASTAIAVPKLNQLGLSCTKVGSWSMVERQYRTLYGHIYQIWPASNTGWVRDLWPCCTAQRSITCHVTWPS